MPAHLRRPTIRRVRDWEPAYSAAPAIAAAISSSLRPPRVPRDLVPLRETLRTVPIAVPVIYDDDDEMEKATLARYLPLKSDIHEILNDPEETLAYMRKVQASVPDPDSALDSLVAVYQDRVERRKRERAAAVEVAPPAPAPVEVVVEKPRDASKARTKRSSKPVDRALGKLQPHVWKIVYGTICVWGLIQLALTR